MIKLTLWDSKWKGYQKKGELEDPIPLLAHGHTGLRATAPQKKEQKFRSNTKTVCHCISPFYYGWFHAVNTGWLSPNRVHSLHCLPELKITAPTSPHCCFCLAVVLLHRSQQSPISVKLQ